jgi:preprotein translocase subunit YajC
MNMLSLIALQAQGGAAMAQPLIILVSFGLIMYFLIIRPQRKIQMQHRDMVEGVKKGDEVMTEGGIIGTVLHIADDRVTIKSADARLIVAKVKIARVLTAPASTTPPTAG